MANISITAASVQISATAKTDSGILGETGTAGQPVYKNDGVGMDGRLYLGDANGSPVTANIVGILVHGGAAGQPAVYVYDDPDFTPGGTLSLSVAADSGVYVLSGTAGAIAPMDDLAAGMYPVILGVAKSTTKMVLKIVKSVTAPLVA
jgi:hypothetical protein